EKHCDGTLLQLVEDQNGGYRLRRMSNSGETTYVSSPIHSDPSVLFDARNHFPEILPFGGVPVDAT
ncbi:MAG: hypothetical protein ACP5VS_19085, partial [Desulfomonilaceae bacterium]